MHATTQAEPSSRFLLSRHVYFCRVRDGLVLLDLRSQKYLGIGNADARRLVSHVDGLSGNATHAEDSTSKDCGELLRSLESRGLLTRRPDAGKKCVELVVPRLSAMEFYGRTDDDPSISLLDLARFLRALISVAARVKLHSLERIVEALNSKKARFRASRSCDETTVRHLLKKFLVLRALTYTSREKCLFDSLVLHGFLTRSGVESTWVIGVSTQPFSAHCWVQHGGTVLNDTLEHTRLYSPILAV